MIEQKLVRVDRPDHPDRCQSNIKTGQCPWTKIPGTNFCPVHTGYNKRLEMEELPKRNYRLAKWQTRLDEFADNDKIKSLREEIGVLRILLEETMSRCHDTNELLLYSNKISELVIKIEKVVASCHRLENATGMLLDKSAALHLAGSIVEIIGRHVTNEQLVESISVDIMQIVIQGKNDNPKEISNIV